MAQAAARKMAASRASSRIAVGVATRGRPEHVRLVVERLRRQTLRPSVVLVAYVEAADVATLPATPELRLIRAEAGLTRQRNAILERLPAAVDFIAFFDDDFLPHPQWLAARARRVRRRARHRLRHWQRSGQRRRRQAKSTPGPRSICWRAPSPSRRAPSRTSVSPYGCNMAFRCAEIADLRFDEALPLYGWLEDRDFAARCRRRRQVRLAAALGVHLGVGAGRMSDRRLGYAQIANPLHLLRRGTMRPGDVAAPRAHRPRLQSLQGAAARPRGGAGLLGNARALADALAGRCRPERAAAL